MRSGEINLASLRVATSCFLGTFAGAKAVVFASFGLFLIPLTQEFGWSRTQVSAALTLSAFSSLIAYPLAGRLADKYGVRYFAIAGNIVLAAAVAALAVMPASLLAFYGLFVVIGFAGAFPSSVLFAKVIVAWFSKQRGMMIGCTTGLGNGLGATLMPLLGAMLIAAGGWRYGFLGLGAAVIAIGLPAMLLFLRNAPADTITLGAVEGGSDLSEGVDLAEARRNPDFYRLLFAIALGAGGLTAVFTHVVPLLLDRGFDMAFATMVLMSFALVTMVWQVVIGMMLDRTPSPRIALPFFCSALVGLLLLMHADHRALIVLGGALMGLGLGTEYSLLPYFIPRYFGRRAYGAIFGMIYGCIVVTLGVAPLFMDIAFDHLGSYNVALYGVAASLMLAAGLILTLRPYAYDSQGVLMERPGEMRTTSEVPKVSLSPI